jgi:hypothetical protein
MPQKTSAAVARDELLLFINVITADLDACKRRLEGEFSDGDRQDMLNATIRALDAVIGDVCGIGKRLSRQGEST